MPGRHGRLIPLLLALSAGSAAAQQANPPPVERTLTGGSVLVLGTSGFNAPMLALRLTGLKDELVAPDVTAGLYLHNTAELADIDLGIGRILAEGPGGGMFLLSVGPSALVAITGGGTGAVIGLQAKAEAILPFDYNLGIRLEMGVNLYRPGQYTTSLWMFGVGLTGLGKR